MSVCVCASVRARVYKYVYARRKSDSSELPKNHYDSLIVRTIFPRMSVYIYNISYTYTRVSNYSTCFSLLNIYIYIYIREGASSGAMLRILRITIAARDNEIHL